MVLVGLRARTRIFPGRLSAGSRPWFVPDKILTRPELVQTKPLLSALPADASLGCRKRMKLKGRLCFQLQSWKKLGK